MAIILCALMLSVTVFAFSASAFSDEPYDWTTVSYTDQNTNTFTVSARGNDIKIVITSNDINGDTLRCTGTADKTPSEIWGDADGIYLFAAYFRDHEDVSPAFNCLEFFLECDCGEGSLPHTISLQKDVRFGLTYYFEEADGTHYYANVGDYFDADGKRQPGGYSGTMSACNAMNISSEGHTLTMTTTLPNRVVGYREGTDRAMQFDSANLHVSGSSQLPFFSSADADTSKPFIAHLIEQIQAVFRRFFELLKRFFTFA